MEQGKIVYRNDKTGFLITESPGEREYSNSDIHKYDKIYKMSIRDNSQPSIEDAKMLVYYLLKNKILENKFQEYKEIIVDGIFKAEADRNKIMYERGYEIN